MHRKGWSVSGPIGEHYPLPFDYEPRRHPVQSQGTYSIKERYRMSLDYVAPSLMLPRALIPPPWLLHGGGFPFRHPMQTSTAPSARCESTPNARAIAFQATPDRPVNPSALWRHNGPRATSCRSDNESRLSPKPAHNQPLPVEQTTFTRNRFADNVEECAHARRCFQIVVGHDPQFPSQVGHRSASARAKPGSRSPR